MKCANIHWALVYYTGWCHISKSNNNNTSTCTYTLLALHIYNPIGLYITIKIAEYILASKVSAYRKSEQESWLNQLDISSLMCILMCHNFMCNTRNLQFIDLSNEIMFFLFCFAPSSFIYHIASRVLDSLRLWISTKCV